MCLTGSGTGFLYVRNGFSGPYSRLRPAKLTNYSARTNREIISFPLFIGQTPVRDLLSLNTLMATYENSSRKRPASVTDSFLRPKGVRLITRAFIVVEGYIMTVFMASAGRKSKNIL